MQLPRCRPTLDDSPIAVLYQQYAPAIFTYVRRHVPSREDAEDVLLEVFLAALESDTLASLSETEQLAWLRCVAHNKFVDHQRRAARRLAVSLEEAAEAIYDDERLAPDQVALRHEEYALLRAHLASLPEQQQEVLRLRFAAGLRCSEIATALNRSEGAIRMLLSRSLNLLRSIYEKREGGNWYG